MRKLIPLVSLLLIGCGYDPDEPDKHTPVTNNQKYHQYFVECLDRMANMPGRASIKYNGDTVEKCDSSAKNMATEYNSNLGVTK